MRTFALSYRRRRPSTTPPRLRRIIAHVPTGCETALKLSQIQPRQFASGPPWALSGTRLNPGRDSPVERLERGAVRNKRRMRRVIGVLGGMFGLCVDWV